MNGLLWNLLLATCWVFLTGSFGMLNYVFGFALGYLVIALIHRQVSFLSAYPYKLPRFIGFVAYFIRELVVSNYKVATDVVTPPWHMQPGVVRFNTKAQTDLEITLLSNVISLTPGTLVLDVSEDKSALFVHAMFMNDGEQVLKSLQELEQRLLEVIR